MKQNTYLFARLFIKLAILLAILVLLGGVGFAVNKFQNMQTELAGLRYTPNPGMETAATNLEKSYLGTNKRILRSLDIEQFPSSVSMIDFQNTLASIKSANENVQAKLYFDLGSATLASVDQVKAYHIAEFVKALKALQQTLLEHAAQLRAQYSTNTNNSTRVLPSNPSGQQTVTPSKSSFRIYSDAPERDKQRLGRIKRVKEYLDYLRTQSKKEESLDQIRRASIYLARAESLLDMLDKSESASNKSDAIPTAGAQQEQETLVAKSEQTAAELGVAIEAIQDEVYKNWTVEKQAQELKIIANDELEKAKQALSSAEKIRKSAIESIASTVVIAFAVAFIIMVVADFMSAFLNLSNNSDTLVINTNR